MSAGVLRSVVALIVATSAIEARAAESQKDKLRRSKAHFDRAEESYQLGRFQEALDEYTEAYTIASLPALLFNMAQCERNLKHYDQAIYFFEQYLDRQKDIPDRPAVEKLIAELNAEREASLRLALANTTTDTATTSLAQTAPPEEDAIYEKWWFWTLVGVAAIAIGATTVALTIGDNVPPGDVVHRF